MRPSYLCYAVVAGWAVPALASDGGATHLLVPDAVWLPLNLAVFLFLLYWFVGRPIARFLEMRREGIAQELEDARRKLAEAEKLREQILSRVEEVEKEKSELLERARQDGRAEAEQVEAQARLDEERLVRRVGEEIDRRRAEARLELAREAAVLTAELSRELLARTVTDADRKRVLERSLSAMHNVAERS